MVDARLDHFDAGLVEPVLHLGLQLLGDLRGVRAQGHVALDVGVVRVVRRQIADGGFRLHLDVVLVVVDFEQGFGGFHDAPDDDGGDLDRVALEVVDFDLRAFEVADAEGDVAPFRTGGWPSGTRRS